MLAVSVVQGGVIALRDFADAHVGHRGLEEQQLAAQRLHHQVGCLQRWAHCTVWLHHNSVYNQ